VAARCLLAQGLARLKSSCYSKLKNNICETLFFLTSTSHFKANQGVHSSAQEKEAWKDVYKKSNKRTVLQSNKRTFQTYKQRIVLFKAPDTQVYNIHIFVFYLFEEKWYEYCDSVKHNIIQSYYASGKKRILT
ncbi:hypothetical protein ACJX0J_010376, partial [Zea mays]